ncbi:hypothetical protein PF002_g31335, partial [Phytophthora fragariae]
MSALRLTELFDVKDKVVVITGGGRGIGRMMADGFVQNGAKVYIASRDVEACQATADELNAKAPSQSAERGRVQEAGRRRRQTRNQSRRPHQQLGRRMGRRRQAPPREGLDQGLVRQRDVSVPRDALLAAAATSDAARVINIGSVAGLMPQQIDSIAYDTSKAAVHHMTRVLAAKLARRPNGGHILVNAIAPGLVPTKLSTGIALVTGKSFEELQQNIPTQRYGHASDMAGLAIFLAS